MLTLAIGDLFIPDRSIGIPEKFQKLLSPNPQSIPTNPKINQVICLGNLTNDLETLKFLYNISPQFHLVKGEFDDINLLNQSLSNLQKDPEPKPDFIQNYKILKIDNLKIGFTNGYLVIPKNDPLSLSALARELDVDVLIYGGTHKVDAYVLDGKFFVNPGSATGAFSFDWQPEEEDEEEKDEGEEEEEEEEEKKEEKEKKDVEKKEEETEKTEKDEKVEDKKDGENEEDKPSTEENEKVEPDDEEEFTSEESNKLESLENTPSFCLLETNNNTCTLYIYTYSDDEIKVDKVTYHKE